MCAFPRHNGSTSTTKKIRKQRVVKNGYIEVDNITIAPGYLYSEWIKLSKEKLLERENALMKIRINKIQSIVSKEIIAFNNKEHRQHQDEYFISQMTAKSVHKYIRNTIEAWNGIDLNKKTSSKPYKTFREYFNVAKNWWDQKKTNIFGQSLWAPILVQIQEVHVFCL